MVRDVTDHDVGHRPNADRRIARGSGSGPGGLRQVTQQQNRGLADVVEFIEQLTPIAMLGLGGGRIGVLFKRRQRSRIGSRDAQRAIGKDTLGVNDVAKQFFDAPLSWSVAVKLLVSIERPQKGQQLVALFA